MDIHSVQGAFHVNTQSAIYKQLDGGSEQRLPLTNATYKQNLY